MGKKNKYVFNIGFNENNPVHKSAADILNRMGHTKADYISQAIFMFEKYGKKREVESAPYDLENLESIIKNIIKKEKENYLSNDRAEINNDNIKSKEVLTNKEKDDICQMLDNLRK